MEEKCSVCYDKLKIENSVITPCNHFFCSNCFFRWLRTKNTCPMCRLDLINRDNVRLNINTYSRELLGIMIKGEEIAQKNMGIINENRTLLTENIKIKNAMEECEDLERKLLIMLEKQHQEIKKQQSNLKDLKHKVRMKKIKEINLKRKKLREYGKINF